MKAGQNSWRNGDFLRRRHSSNSRNGRRKTTTRRSRPKCACSLKPVLRNRIAFGERPHLPSSAAYDPELVQAGRAAEFGILFYRESQRFNGSQFSDTTMKIHR